MNRLFFAGIPLLLALLGCTDKTSGDSSPPADDSDSNVIPGCEDEDLDGDGSNACEDCNDEAPEIYPNAEEDCDGVDNDCDGEIDESGASGQLYYADADADGYGDPTQGSPACSQPDGSVDNGDDCDDTDDAVHPDAPELCNEADDDCDDVIDEDATDAPTWYEDSDSDGYGADGATQASCTQPEGYVDLAGDCDDTDTAYHPSATEDCADPNDYNCDGSVGYEDGDGDGYPACTECDDGDPLQHPDADETCNDEDDDCDGDVDEDALDALTWYGDADGDGYGTEDSTAAACDLPDGYADNTDDCDDSDALVSPDGTEQCDERDNDCDGATDEDDAIDALTWYTDDDGDGYGDPAGAQYACSQPGDAVENPDDCDDSNAAVSPDAQEQCNEIDDNCDGDTDEDSAIDALTWYADTDEDSYGDPDQTTAACATPDGYVDNDVDCDDDDTDVNPDADERCDGIDNNCDGDTDEDSAVDGETWYADADGDDYGAADDTTSACSRPDGYVDDASDCDDADGEIYPGAPEACNSADDDCDGDTDEGEAVGALTWYADADGDSYGDPDDTSLACDQPVGTSDDATDCDDTDADIHPDADELCNSADDDCDGTIDEATAVDASTWYRDSDKDGYGLTSKTKVACTRPGGYKDKSGDCDDADATVNPGKTELCNSKDDDCDGTTDESSASDASTWYADSDDDGYGDAGSTTKACAAPSGYLADKDDCDDDDADVNPSADEVCNDTDDDCDGSVDNSAIDEITWYQDNDDDGYGQTSKTKSSCDQPSGYADEQDDCDDADDTVYPGAPETCDGEDDDCDGDEDEDAIDGDTWYTDLDSDGYGDDASTTISCRKPTGAVSAAGDCDDAEADVNPGETEVCGDGLDNNCDSSAGTCALDDLALNLSDATLVGESTNDKSGAALSFAGDVDGDGNADLLVGAAGNDRTALSAGTAYLVLGAPSGLTDLSTADAILTGETSSDAAGTSVAGPGDVDGDGYADLLIGADAYDPSGASNGGVAYLVQGPVSGTSGLKTAADGKFTGESGSDNAGGFVGGGGDLDGDNLADLLVGARNYDSGGSSSVGAVYVLAGSPSGTASLSTAVAVITGSSGFDYAYRGVIAGDLDGDGNDDLLIGAEGADEPSSSSGAVCLFEGPVSGDAAISDADATIGGEKRSDYLGAALAAAGDTDGDGYLDVLLGAPGEDSGGSAAGAAYLVLGPISTDFSVSAADAKLTGVAKSDAAGTSVSGAGDTDGDGLHDLLIGAYANDDAGSDAGAAYLFLGAPSGTLSLSSADAVLSGGASGDAAGVWVSGGGDANGDGYMDLLVGANAEDSGGSGAGATYLLLGAGL